MPDFYSVSPYSHFEYVMKFRKMLANWYVKSGKVHLTISYTNIFTYHQIKLIKW